MSPPEGADTGPLFDPLHGEGSQSSDPPEQESAEELVPRASPRVRTNVIPRGDISSLEVERDAVESRSPSRARSSSKRVRRTLRHVDPVSVLKLSLIYYACFLLIWLLAVAFLYSLLESTGLFDAIEGFARGAVLLERGQELGITLWVVERWAFLIGLTLVVVGSLVNVFLAFLYNLASDLVGGIELTFSERDL